MTRRDHLYGDLIEEASRLFSDTLTLEFDEPSKFVRLHTLIERLCLFASAKDPSTPEIPRRLAAFQIRPPVNVMR
jgi:hypothetical protein